MTKIVVGVDSSPGSKAALAWAVDEGRIRHASVEAVHVWELPVYAATPIGAFPIDVGEYQEDAMSEFEAAIDEVDASGLPGPIERTFVAGSPAQRLLEAAEGAALLVVGARGHGGFAGLLLGSVSHQVTHHAPCPVVVVPHDD